MWVLFGYSFLDRRPILVWRVLCKSNRFKLVNMENEPNNTHIHTLVNHLCCHQKCIRPRLPITRSENKKHNWLKIQVCFVGTRCGEISKLAIFSLKLPPRPLILIYPTKMPLNLALYKASKVHSYHYH